MTFLNPLDALIPKIPFSFFPAFWVWVTSGAWESDSVGFWGSCQLSPFWGRGGSGRRALSTPPPPSRKRKPSLPFPPKSIAPKSLFNIHIQHLQRKPQVWVLALIPGGWGWRGRPSFGDRSSWEWGTPHLLGRLPKGVGVAGGPLGLLPPVWRPLSFDMRFGFLHNTSFFLEAWRSPAKSIALKRPDHGRHKRSWRAEVHRRTAAGKCRPTSGGKTTAKKCNSGLKWA